MIKVMKIEIEKLKQGGKIYTALNKKKTVVKNKHDGLNYYEKTRSLGQ